MKAYLITFMAKVYCQGWSNEHVTLLVYAESFEEACKKIKARKEYENPNYFENLTLF